MLRFTRRMTAGCEALWRSQLRSRRLPDPHRQMLDQALTEAAEASALLGGVMDNLGLRRSRLHLPWCGFMAVWGRLTAFTTPRFRLLMAGHMAVKSGLLLRAAAERTGDMEGRAGEGQSLLACAETHEVVAREIQAHARHQSPGSETRSADAGTNP